MKFEEQQRQRETERKKKSAPKKQLTSIHPESAIKNIFEKRNQSNSQTPKNEKKFRIKKNMSSKDISISQKVIPAPNVP